MNISAFATARLGATVTPAHPSASGTYEISISTARKPGRFPNLTRVLSTKLTPLNRVVSGGTANLAKVTLHGSSTDEAGDQLYWTATGWLSSNTDADGDATNTGGGEVTGFAIYNGTPYIIKWGIFQDGVADAATFHAQACMFLLPGATVAFDNGVVPIYYNNSGTWVYDVVAQGFMEPAVLHLACTNAPASHAAYDAATGELHDPDGAVEVVLLHRTPGIQPS